MKQQDKVFLVVGSTAVLVTAGITGAWLFGKPDPVTTPSSVSSTTPTSTNDSGSESTTTESVSSVSSSNSSGVTTPNNSYKDGTYSAKVSYYVPKASNDLTAKVTVSGGTVTAVTVDHNYYDHESERYIDSFENALQSAVVGKSIDGLSLGRIGGATLTTQAFDDALTTVRNEAKA